MFQRPDDAIHRGYDKQTEADFAQPDNFFSNYEPLPRKDRARIDRGRHRLLSIHRADAGADSKAWPTGGAGVILSPRRNPRLVDGKPTKNPRYLQKRPDLANPRESYLAEMAARLRRRLPPGKPVHNPVAAVLPGRRNNPPETGHPLARRATIRSITSSCRNCSWNSFAA